MDFFNIFKILCEQTDDDQLRQMNKLLAEKDESIEQLQRTKDRLSMELAFVTMEHYTLSDIFKYVSYQKNYQKVLESQIDQLLEATLKLGHILQRVEWHKIVDYDELVNSDKRRENERLQMEMKKVFDRMENRSIAKEFRLEQKENQKLDAMLIEVNRAIAQQRVHNQSMINAAIRKRNRAILDLVIGSKKLKEFRSKKLLKRSTVPKEAVGVHIENIEQIMKPTSNVTVSNTGKSVEKLADDIQSIDVAIEKDSPLETVFKPSRTLLNMHFNSFNYEKFDFEKFNVNQKVTDVDGSLENLSELTTNLRPILCNPLNDSRNNKVSAQSKRDKHVTILLPQSSEGSFEEEISSAPKDSIQKSNAEEELAETTCSNSVKSTASEPMETDNEIEMSDQIREVDFVETNEAPSNPVEVQEFAENKKRTVTSNEGQEKSLDSHQEIFFSLDLNMDEGSSRHRKEEIPKAKKPQNINEPDSKNPAKSIEPSLLFKDLLKETSPQKTDDQKNLYFSDTEQQSNLDDMFSHESDFSDNGSSGARISKDFF